MDGLILNYGPAVWHAAYLIGCIVCFRYARKLREPALLLTSFGFLILEISKVVSSFTSTVMIHRQFITGYKVLYKPEQMPQLLLTEGIALIGVALVALGLSRALRSLNAKMGPREEDSHN